MTKEVGTLREIGARVGDVVEFISAEDIYYNKHKGSKWTVFENDVVSSCGTYHFFAFVNNKYRIIRRAAQPFHSLTAEEKGALMLANHEGKIIEMSLDGGETWERSYTPQWIGAACYRVRADEVKEVILNGMDCKTSWAFSNSIGHGETHRITFNLVNGKPDCASVKMEEIK